jgi:DNA (cytosine-5)-methyltransferase 1
MYFNEFDRYPAAWLRNLYPSATVDERSIADVGPNDVTGTRAHFFAGIGGWEYALDLAGWPADRPVWTGSCPCQPFSAAGRGLGADDPRHLWPAFYRLIAERRPPTVFGEQVGGAAGRAWLSAVRADLEALGYAVGAADLCAAGVGAPHIRQRLYWVANADGAGGAEQISAARPVGSVQAWAEPNGRGKANWFGSEWLPCTDRRSRPTQSGVRPLAHGVPARASKLRAYGNAIVPQVAAVFVRAFLDCEVAR